MKLSDLIKLLQAQLNEHDDLVMFFEEDANECSCMRCIFSKTEGSLTLRFDDTIPCSGACTFAINSRVQKEQVPAMITSERRRVIEQMMKAGEERDEHTVATPWLRHRLSSWAAK
jgi:hypothetical protein